jgi:hypothetical protein
VFGRAPEDTSYVVVAADLELDVDGSFELAIVALDTLPSVDLSRTTPALRVITSELRRRDEDLAAALASGALVETPDGLVDAKRIDGQPLGDFAEMKRFAASVNELRGLLYDHLAEDGTDADREAVSAVLPQLWNALR